MLRAGASRRNERLYWENAFDSTIVIYAQVKSLNSQTPLIFNYSSVEPHIVDGLHGSAVPSRVVEPFLADFIADVELAMGRVLTAEEMLSVMQIFDGNFDEEHIKVAHEIKQKAGKMFIARHIYPVCEYFTPKDTR